MNRGMPEICDDFLDNDCDWDLDCDDSDCQNEPRCQPPCPGDPDCPPGTWGCTHEPRECHGFYFDCACYMDTPVVVDVEGDGVALTDAAGGVEFDIDADGTRPKVAWTAAGSDDAWLALDRDGNGSIDSAAELFGDVTPQPPSGELNGFLALAEFDKPARGGNADGLLDERDAVAASLRLWRDANHDGLSEPGELHTLRSLGLRSIHLDYKASRRTDRHGNKFRYRAKVTDVRGAQTGRWAWDVFLLRAL